jgi:hypothetical protein
VTDKSNIIVIMADDLGWGDIKEGFASLLRSDTPTLRRFDLPGEACHVKSRRQFDFGWRLLAGRKTATSA